MQNQANSTHILACDVAGTASGNNTAAVNVRSTEELSFFTKSDSEILESIIRTHVHADDSIDVESLFLVVQNIMTRSTQIFDYVVQVYMYYIYACVFTYFTLSFSYSLKYDNVFVLAFSVFLLNKS